MTRLSRQVFAEMLTGADNVADALGAGKIAIDGDAGALVELFGLLEQPDFEFDIVTP